jgi:hypothetical protein
MLAMLSILCRNILCPVVFMVAMFVFHVLFSASTLFDHFVMPTVYSSRASDVARTVSLSTI